MTEPSARTNPVFSHIGAYGALLSRGVQHRLDLAACEAHEARLEIGRLLMLHVLTLAAAFFASLLATASVVALVWPLENRIFILIGLALGLFILSGIVGFLAWRRLQQWTPFQEIRHQVRADAECLQNLMGQP